MKRLLLLLYISLIFSSNLFAQVSLKTGVSKSTINIGDYITYYISITYNKDYKLIFPPPGKELGSFDIKDYNIYEEESKDKEARIKIIEYEITTYFLGEFEIPSIEIQYEDKDKKKGSIRTEPLVIKVVPIKRLPSDKDNIRDIKEQEYVKTYFWLYITIVIAVIGLAITGYFYYKKHYKKQLLKIEPEKEIRKVPEDIEALEKIKTLQEKDYLKNQKYKIFYFELNEIIREYLHKRYDIYTLERTSYEIMLDLKKILEDKKLLQSFNSFFEHTDLVKFAKYKPTHNEIKGAIDKAIQLVNITKRKYQTDEAA